MGYKRFKEDEKIIEWMENAVPPIKTEIMGINGQDRPIYQFVDSLDDACVSE